jgi:glycosyltransferase involved in cell wall biosynthesis
MTNSKHDTLISKRPLQNKSNLSIAYPKLCFVLPTYNREKTIGSALEQITSQILRSKFRESISVLVSENQSIDRSAEIARSFASRHDFIRVITPEHHLPSGEHNLFFALRQISTDFVMPFADDDLFLPGAIDRIYEFLLKSKADYILINSQYQDSSGQILRDRILDTIEDTVCYDSFAEMFSEIGPLTLLASFSSSIYRLEKVVALNFDDFLSPCPIYAHIFAYLEAFAGSRTEVISLPLVVLRRTTESAHWENVAKQFGWYMYYPWTGSLAIHLLRARSRNAITIEQYGFALNSNENGRYGLIANMLTQFVLQLFRALETGDPREIPPCSDFRNIHAVLQGIPYVTVETLDFLLWGEKNFGEICALLAPQGSILQSMPNRLTNIIQNFDIPEYTTSWIPKIREKLIERLRTVESPYANFGTISSNARPFIFMTGRKFVIFQLATKFILMSQTTYQENWQAMNPNCLDPVNHPSDWFIFYSFDAALERYSELEHASAASETEPGDRVIFKIAKTPPWNALEDVIETEDVQSFLEAVSYSPALKEVHQVLNTILDLSSSKTNVKLDLFSLESARQGFINPRWYKETYSPLTQGMERKILQQSPLVHYVMLGARKGWSLSPFFDEFFFIGTTKTVTKKTSLLSDRVGLAKYFTEGGESDTSPFFLVRFYLEQCKQNSIVIEGSPIIHFLTTGINLGFSPHPNWDEVTYMRTNPDIQLSSDNKPFYGWLHWCTYGRFEKRMGLGNFTMRGE